MHLPEFLLKIIFGKELCEELFTTGLKIIPSKAVSGNYLFKYEDLNSAIKQII